MKQSPGNNSDPAGGSTSKAAAARSAKREGYREARSEYAEIRKLRKKNWIAAHIRERRSATSC